MATPGTMYYHVEPSSKYSSLAKTDRALSNVQDRAGLGGIQRQVDRVRTASELPGKFATMQNPLTGQNPLQDFDLAYGAGAQASLTKQSAEAQGFLNLQNDLMAEQAIQEGLLASLVVGDPEYNKTAAKIKLLETKIKRAGTQYREMSGMAKQTEARLKSGFTGDLEKIGQAFTGGPRKPQAAPFERVQTDSVTSPSPYPSELRSLKAPDPIARAQGDLSPEDPQQRELDKLRGIPPMDLPARLVRFADLTDQERADLGTLNRSLRASGMGRINSAEFRAFTEEGRYSTPLGLDQSGLFGFLQQRWLQLTPEERQLILSRAGVR